LFPGHRELPVDGYLLFDPVLGVWLGQCELPLVLVGCLPPLGPCELPLEVGLCHVVEPVCPANESVVPKTKHEINIDAVAILRITHLQRGTTEPSPQIESLFRHNTSG
jgi:hypothetical protein